MNPPPANEATTLSSDAAALVEYLSRKPTGGIIPPHDMNKIDSRMKKLQFSELLQVIEFGQPTKAITVQLYQRWIEANTGRSPHVFAAWFNLGTELSTAGDRANSVIANRNALALKPDFYQAAVNLGLSLEALGNPGEALDAWGRALQPEDARTALLNQRGRLFEAQKRLDEAEKSLRASLQTVPLQPDALQHWIHIRQKMCKWPIFGRETVDLSREEMTVNMGPLGALAEYDEIAVQYRIADEWLKRKTYDVPVRLSPAEGYRHDKIRLGYMSSDFHMHAMSFLIAELFERHDRERFEVYGYCSTTEDGSEVRRRVLGAFDKYVPIRELTDEQAAFKIREDEIDILIDLNGLTLGGRFQALRWRPAPVQMTYLGYIGPVPMPELDYILCDDYVIPKDRAAAYHPKPLHLPGIYQSNDTKLEVGTKITRAEAGLPEDKFVFCCFNNHYKITEPVFGAWMSIMNRAPDSVLWLTNDDPWSTANLRAVAASRGVDPDRLIFSERVAPQNYLARLAVPDLFLDTFPYNAGTVASDALRMGLPLVTLSGESFVSRMAGSLLSTVGLTDAIAGSLDEYVEIASGVALDKAKHAKWRKALSGDKWRNSIGNIELFVRQFEDTLASVVLNPDRKPVEPLPWPAPKARPAAKPARRKKA